MCDDLTQPAPIDAVAKRRTAAYFDRMAQLVKDDPRPAVRKVK